MVEAKPLIKTTPDKVSKPTLKSLIRKYLMEDCFILKDIKDKQYDFGFDIRYPKLLDKDGNQKGRIITVLKPKGKNYLEILNKFKLDNEGLDTFNKSDDFKKNTLKTELRTYLINQNLLQTVDLENNNITYLDKIYFTKSNFPDINNIYHSIIKIINTQIIILDILTTRLDIKNKIDSGLKSEASYFQ